MADDEAPHAPSLIVVDDSQAGGPVQAGDAAEQRETVEQPAKVMRIGSMIKQLLEEVRAAPIDEASRAHLKEIYETSVRELAEGLSPDLRDELDRMAMPFQDDAPSDSELRVAQAQLVGWLEGLFHGIQATLFAQQMAAQAQLQQMRNEMASRPSAIQRPRALNLSPQPDDQGSYRVDGNGVQADLHRVPAHRGRADRSDAHRLGHPRARHGPRQRARRQ